MENRFLIPGTLKQGYLTKSPPLDKNTAVFKGWKKRWVILYLSQRELFLQYYENEESARGSSPPKSTVSLKFCEKVDVDLEHSTYKNVFAIYLPERTYYFSAPSHFEMNEWSETICSFLKANKAQGDTTTLGAGSFSTMPLSGRYGSHTLPSNSSAIPMSNTYGTYGLAGPLPTSPGHYGSAPYSPMTRGGVSEFSSSYGSLSGSGSVSPSFSTIQSRGLPPIPPDQGTLDSSKTLEDQAPPVPPRFHSNLYSATPTR